MRMPYKISFFFIAVLLLAVLNSCSFGIASFIRNFSNDPLTVVIKFPSDINLQINSIPFDNQILAIRKKTIKFLNDSLIINKIDHSSFSFVVPGNSTAVLWPALSVHFDSLNFVSAIVRQGTFSDTLKLDSKKKLKSAFQTVYYDFKRQIK